jgi:hypothetical protein
VSTDIYIPHLFGPGTPVLVPIFQCSGCPNSGILLLFGLGLPKIQASQELSTDYTFGVEIAAFFSKYVRNSRKLQIVVSFG